jgi:hydroxyquinol 1,2-dioxygenase
MDSAMKSKVQHQSQAQASTRNLSAQAVTAAVIDRMKSSRSDRFKQVMASLIEHLHAFARDVQLSEQEWAFAIDFLTKTGQSCTSSRQEFILLSDTLGLSTLVTQMNHPSQGKETEQTVLGPFHRESAPQFPLGADIAAGIDGKPLFISGTVSDSRGQPIAGARVDIWHADPRGEYDVQKPALDGAMRLRGVFHTDAAGRFHCWSIKPTCYPVPTDGPVGLLLKASKRHPMRPAHVHFMIDAKGFDRLITHVFEAGDRYIDSDAVFGVRDALIIPFKLKRNKTGPDGSVMHRSYYHIHYDFHMRTPKSKPKRQNKASR